MPLSIFQVFFVGLNKKLLNRPQKIRPRIASPCASELCQLGSELAIPFAGSRTHTFLTIQNVLTKETNLSKWIGINLPWARSLIQYNIPTITHLNNHEIKIGP